ncbi:hypothetical protein HPB49_014885 [Dermacentor silvarum]|uniref:Uncharacterized protein n=1 Tax=Dermacentor silvarum TaxID=543639 RepID=A0ACB8D615_DERSI|nr:hypothetical protein HPB49_014885 [Dermacentor silvarum]
MASPEHPELHNDVPLPEDMDLQAPDKQAASLTPLTSTRNSAVAAMPSRALQLLHTNPFDPLQDLEEQNGIEGESANTFYQAHVISTAPNGEERARGSLFSTPERQYTSIPRDYSHARGARHMLPALVGRQDEEDNWIPVSYRRTKQNHAMGAAMPSSGAPRKLQHAIILWPKQPCRIMDEQFIRLDRVMMRYNSAHLSLSEGDPMPGFSVRHLRQSNQLAVDVAKPEVRSALLAIASLPIRGQDVPFQAYEAFGHNQIRCVIRNAGEMTSEELMNSLHCRKCKILQSRPLGDKGTVMVTYEGTSLPYKPASEGGSQHPRRDAAQSKVLTSPGDNPYLPAPTTLQDLERRLENRVVQIGKFIHQSVQQLINRAIKTCVHTIMGHIMLSGTLPYGTIPLATAGAPTMRTTWVPSNFIASDTTKPHHV